MQTNQDMWPAEFGVGDTTPPVMILREQATYLTKKTKGKVEGQVRTMPDGQEFRHCLYLVAPALDNYEYRLLCVWHPIELYPLRLMESGTDELRICSSEFEFLDQLATVLKGDKAQKVVQSLLSQTESAVA